MPNILYLNQFKTTTLSVVGGIDDSQTTGIVIQSVSGLDTTKPGIACLTYTDPLDLDNAEYIEYTAINSTTKTFTGVTRGAEGYSAKSHSNGVTVAFPVSESHVNRLADAVSIGGDPTNPITGVLDEDTMSSDSAVKVPTQQSVKAYVDANAGGDWKDLGQTLTYTSADDPTYVATVSGVDMTSTLSVGMKIRVSQSTGGTKYFIITAILFSTDTTITLYGGTDYNLENEAISSPVYSSADSPYGFPKDPTKWTQILTDTANRSQGTPSSGVWYNLGSLSLSIPIGAWHVSYNTNARLDVSSNVANMYTALSTANNSSSDADLQNYLTGYTTSALSIIATKTKTLVLASKTPYYLNAMTNSASLATTIAFRGDLGSTIIKAVCAYL